METKETRGIKWFKNILLILLFLSVLNGLILLVLNLTIKRGKISLCGNYKCVNNLLNSKGIFLRDIINLVRRYNITTSYYDSFEIYEQSKISLLLVPYKKDFYTIVFSENRDIFKLNDENEDKELLLNKNLTLMCFVDKENLNKFANHLSNLNKYFHKKYVINYRIEMVNDEIFNVELLSDPDKAIINLDILSPIDFIYLNLEDFISDFIDNLSSYFEKCYRDYGLKAYLYCNRKMAKFLENYFEKQFIDEYVYFDYSLLKEVVDITLFSVKKLNNHLISKLKEDNLTLEDLYKSDNVEEIRMKCMKDDTLFLLFVVLDYLWELTEILYS